MVKYLVIEGLNQLLSEVKERHERAKILKEAQNAWRRAGLCVSRSAQVYFPDSGPDGIVVEQCPNTMLCMSYRPETPLQRKMVRVTRKIFINSETTATLTITLEDLHLPKIDLDFVTYCHNPGYRLEHFPVNPFMPQKSLGSSSFAPMVPETEINLPATLQAISDLGPGRLVRPLLPLLP